MTKKRRCSFRMPTAEELEGAPGKELWRVECDCGITIFGSSRKAAEETWLRHVKKE